LLYYRFTLFFKKRTTIASFNPFAVYVIRRYDPNIVTQILIKRYLISDWFTTQKKSIPVNLSKAPKLFLNFIQKFSALSDFFLFFSLKTWLPYYLGVGIIGSHLELVLNGEINYNSFQSYVFSVWVVNDLSIAQNLLNQNISVTTDNLFNLKN
jgi:hypothetical protein